jgi:hypothetical protein
MVIAASPFSNWPPIISSMFMNGPMALTAKPFLPVMLHTTTTDEIRQHVSKEPMK